MHNGFDIGFVVALTLLWPLYDYLIFPRTKRRMAGAPVGERGRHYLGAMVAQWAFTAVAIALTIAGGRASASIGLRLPSGWGLAWSLVVLGLVIVLLIVQSRAAFGSERGRAALRKQLLGFGWLLPRDGREMRWFVALCLTAGICEEVLFRGYLLWFLIPKTGLALALILSSLAFGLMHAYQGARGIVRTGIVGLTLALIYRLTGSLAAPMIVHALVDWAGGRLSYRLAAEDRAAGATRS
jgi:membrane protease YdiL (CAAX protease family)